MRGSRLAFALALSVSTGFLLAAETAATIDVQGRGLSIVSGDTTPTAADDTEFGMAAVIGTGAVSGTAALSDPATTSGTTSVGDMMAASGTGAVNSLGSVSLTRARHSFMIRNAGTAALNLTGTPVVAKSGANAADFTITQPAVTSLAPGRTVMFDVTFVPLAPGVRTATLAIASNDSDESPYTFAVRGTGGPVIVPYVPTAQQISLTTSAGAGEFRATVAVQFNSGGYSVDWGQAIVQGNTLTMNARIYQSTGAATQALLALSHVYSLGRLAAGNFQLVFKVADQTVKTASLAINTLATTVTPAGAGRVDLYPAPVGENNYLAGTTVSVVALPLAPTPLPLSTASTPVPPTGTTLAPSAIPTPISGYVFQNWSGGATGTANPVTVTLDANKSVTANFAVAPALPTVTTGSVTQITATSARVEGTVVSIGGSPVTERGFLLNALSVTPYADGTTTSSVPTAAIVAKFAEGAGAGTFARTLTALSAETTYFLRAYATNTTGTAYGQSRPFTTAGVSNANTAPTISDIADQSIRAGTSTGALAFTLGDAETAPANLTVVGVVSSPSPLAGGATGVVLNPLPAASLVFGGSGANRTVTVTPTLNQTGPIMVAITVRDTGGLTATETFMVTIGSPPSGPSATLTAHPNYYLSTGGSVTFTATLTHAGTMSSVSLAVGSVPTGWTYGATGGQNVPSVVPVKGDTSQFGFAYLAVPASPTTFTFTVNYPAGLAGSQVFAGISGLFRLSDGMLQTAVVPPIALVRAEAPTIVSAPPTRAVRLGGTTTFAVTAGGAAPLTYQWIKDGVALANDTRIGGATSRALTIANAQFADAGAYTVVVENTMGSVTSEPAAILAVVDARHAVAGANDATGGTLSIGNTLTYAGTPTALAWQVILPAGWSYASSTGAEGDIKPVAGATALAEWAWTTVPVSPISFSYTLSVPAGATGDKALQAVLLFRMASGLTHLLVLPDPLVAPNRFNYHSADTNGDGRISLIELTRVLELYNTRNGTTRTGHYTVTATASEDGFAPEPSRANTVIATLTRYCSADSNHDGKLSLMELTRVLELYNARNGTVRTGAYHEVLPPADSTEDGFAPGP